MVSVRRNLIAILGMSVLLVVMLVMLFRGVEPEHQFRQREGTMHFEAHPEVGHSHEFEKVEESGKGGTILVSEFYSEPPATIPEGPGSQATGFEGNLLDPVGDPIEGAEIAIVPKLVQDGQTHRVPWSREVVTDRHGRFLITTDIENADVTGGQVVLTCEGGTPDRVLYYSKRIDVIRGEIVDLGDLVVGSVGASFVATVRDESGRPVEGAGVRFLFPTGSVSGVTATTNEHGLAQVVGIACYGDTEPDHFRCFLEHPSWLFPGKDVKVEPDRTKAYLPGGRVDFVIRTEDPEPDFNFAIFDYKGPPQEPRSYGATVLRDSYWVDQSFVPFQLYDTFSAVPIRVRIKDVPPRKFAVEVYACDGSGDYMEARLSPATYQNMPVLMGSAATWKRGVEARGRLLAEDGSPIADRYVMLHLKASGMTDGPRYREARTQPNGVFVFHSLPPCKELAVAVLGAGRSALHAFTVPATSTRLELPDLTLGR